MWLCIAGTTDRPQTCRWAVLSACIFSACVNGSKAAVQSICTCVGAATPRAVARPVHGWSRGHAASLHLCLRELHAKPWFSRVAAAFITPSGSPHPSHRLHPTLSHTPPHTFLPQALCANPGFSAYLLDQLSETARSQGLKGFEQVKALHLEHQQFSVDNGLMTPKFSLKRPALLKR